MVGKGEERIAAEHAHKVMGMLSISGGNPNLEAIIQILRKAKDAATFLGARPSFSSEETRSIAAGCGLDRISAVPFTFGSEGFSGFTMKPFRVGLLRARLRDRFLARSPKYSECGV